MEKFDPEVCTSPKWSRKREERGDKRVDILTHLGLPAEKPRPPKTHEEMYTIFKRRFPFLIDRHFVSIVGRVGLEPAYGYIGIYNQQRVPHVFRVKTSHNALFDVHPSFGWLWPGGRAEITVKFLGCTIPLSSKHFVSLHAMEAPYGELDIESVFQREHESFEARQRVYVDYVWSNKTAEEASNRIRHLLFDDLTLDKKCNVVGRRKAKIERLQKLIREQNECEEEAEMSEETCRPIDEGEIDAERRQWWYRTRELIELEQENNDSEIAEKWHDEPVTVAIETEPDEEDLGTEEWVARKEREAEEMRRKLQQLEDRRRQWREKERLRDEEKEEQRKNP